jgi:FkbM family methyltransferase
MDRNSSDKVRRIVDAGANIGDETIRFRYFHPEATIIAIEPEVNNFRLLTQNTQNDPKIICLNKGLWSRECRLKVIPGTVNENFKVAEMTNSSEKYDIEAISVDRLMREFDLPEIDILKMDIEGAERQVFDAESVMDWITRVKVIILECPDNDYPGTTILMFEKLLQSGRKFNCYIHGENIVLIRSDVKWTLSSDLLYET